MTGQTSDTMMVYTPPCMMCGERSQLEMTQEQFDLYTRGALVQDAFPDWPLSKRELVMTGTHSACWDRMMPPTEE